MTVISVMIRVVVKQKEYKRRLGRRMRHAYKRNCGLNEKKMRREVFEERM